MSCQMTLKHDSMSPADLEEEPGVEGPAVAGGVTEASGQEQHLEEVEGKEEEKEEEEQHQHGGGAEEGAGQGGEVLAQAQAGLLGALLLLLGRGQPGGEEA